MEFIDFFAALPIWKRDKRLTFRTNEVAPPSGLRAAACLLAALPTSHLQTPISRWSQHARCETEQSLKMKLSMFRVNDLVNRGLVLRRSPVMSIFDFSWDHMSIASKLSAINAWWSNTPPWQCLQRFWYWTHCVWIGDVLRHGAYLKYRNENVDIIQRTVLLPGESTHIRQTSTW